MISPISSSLMGQTLNLRKSFPNAIALADDSEWWTLGIPKAVRLKVSERQEQDDNKRGGRNTILI